MRVRFPSHCVGVYQLGRVLRPGIAGEKRCAPAVIEQHERGDRADDHDPVRRVDAAEAPQEIDADMVSPHAGVIRGRGDAVAADHKEQRDADVEMMSDFEQRVDGSGVGRAGHQIHDRGVINNHEQAGEPAPVVERLETTEGWWTGDHSVRVTTAFKQESGRTGGEDAWPTCWRVTLSSGDHAAPGFGRFVNKALNWDGHSSSCAAPTRTRALWSIRYIA